MAEIEIQRKKRPVWPWILAAIVALLLLWFIIDYFNDDREVAETEVVVATPDDDLERRRAEASAYEGMPGEIIGFLNFAKQEQQNVNMSVHHEYTRRGLQQLSDALTYINAQKAAAGENLDSKIQDMRAIAEKITHDPKSTQHADLIRTAFMKATDVMAGLQQKSFPDLKDKVDNVRQAAESIDPKVLTLDQQSKVKSFFDKSAEVVETMGRNLQGQQ